MSDTTPLPCIVLAGGIPTERHSLYPHTGARQKALLSIGGHPMISYVLQALRQASTVGAVCVVGLDNAASLADKTFPNSGKMHDHLEIGLRWAQQLGAKRAIVTTADIPLLTSAAVDAFVSACDQSAGINYSLVPEATLETAFPNSRRTYFKLREGSFSGGNLHIAETDIYTKLGTVAAELEMRRKHPLRMAAWIGPRLLLQMALRRLSLRQIEQVAEERLGKRCEAVISAEPTLAFDVDTAEQLARVSATLTAH